MTSRTRTRTWRIETEKITMPDHLTRDTGLPHDPQGDIRTGYTGDKSDLPDVVFRDAQQGGTSTITPVEWDDLQDCYVPVAKGGRT